MPTDLETFDVPEEVTTDGWTLDVTGTVERPLRLGPADLRAAGLETVTDDFSCVEGWTASDLTWRGVPVETLLADSRPTEAANFGLVRAMDDGYACSFPLDRLREGLLAVELDGEALPVEHGGPARLVPAGSSDCWESVKWVSAIEIREDEPEAADTAKDVALSRVE